MNRKLFYDSVRPALGALTIANVEGFERVLDEAGRRRTSLNQLAYILATGWWESAKTMQAVKEAFWKDEAWRKRNLRYYPYYGRGLVQLTWEANYKKASALIDVDLVANPDLALDPMYSVTILFDGLERGWFTGKALDDYIDEVDEVDAEDLREYKEARRTVNGIDRAAEIGRLALAFEKALRAAGYGGAVPLPEPPARSPPPSPVVSGGIGAGLAVAVMAVLAVIAAILRRVF